MTFFKPDDSFLDWLKVYAGDRTLVDVGCGEGKLLERMWAKGIKVLGVEMRDGAIIDEITTRMRTLHNMDARKCPFLRKTPVLAMFCRPNHTGWVEGAVRALHPDSDALYFSASRNLEIDLPGFEVEELEVPGLQEESAFLVKKPYPPMSHDHKLMTEAAERVERYLNNLSYRG